MEQVFLAEMGASRNGMSLAKRTSFLGSSGEGVVEKVLKPGSFVIVLGDGRRIEVRGAETIQVGARVSILPPPGRVKDADPAYGTEGSGRDFTEGLQWFALIPLAFGGKNASARLEVFVERQREGAGAKGDLASYFIFTVQTEDGGEVQWSVYLKGRQLALQVFSELKAEKKELYKKLIFEVEASLRKRGFVIMSQAVLLSRPFKVPSGFRLNVRG